MSSVSGIMNAVNLGEGIQVVKLGTGAERYELDERALRGLLLQPHVRDLPVVVVSVAGIFRGGKSFLLDFFLRYLNAPRSSQLSGEWLGRDDEPLQGFHWRGGGDRHTTGIHLWSHPFLTTLQSTGETVAVLLMDTQGTFDSESTIGETSVIFALSTLISSVQVYNLRNNISEADLQHLQFFTEYGRLACDGDERAFQTLTFLVRDWASGYQHAHSFGGGEALLNSRLNSVANQKPELREVREHIRSCFHKINCFLMPHLGHEAVAEESFAGCLRDISRGFKSALIELVPSFFDPEHLTPKVINGERVKTRDLLEYFQSYVNIFNSDDTPVAVTILRATADACILAAVREARDLYESRMQARLRDEISVPASVLTALNDVARRDAIQRYNQKKKLGSQDSVAYHLEQLNTELDARLALYTSKNNDKFRDTESLARTAYRNVVSAVCEVHERLCLHPLDLTDLHAEALTAAVTLFDSTRHVLEDEEDEERVAFVRSLEEYYAHLCEVNEQKNRNAVLEARDLYVTRMQQQMIQVGVSSGLLQALHQRALDDARAFFANKRSRATERQDDPYLQQLLEEISGSFANFERVNVNNNTAALQGAKDSYNNYMSSAWGSRSYCFHPRALEDLHNTAKRQSLQQFLANRPESEHNEYEARLVEVVNSLYSELRTTNELINDQTVNEAYELYETKQEDHLNPSQTWTRFIPGYTKAELEMLPTLLPGYHAQSKEEAVQKFYSRRLGERHDGDVYYARLIEVAVLLMDTQGTFDSESTIGETSVIFALSTLISSVQVYNLRNNISEADLQHLQFFTEYGRLACDGDERAFQTLTFLVRDWASGYQHAHSFGGGEALLNSRLNSVANQKPELREVREHIRSCFHKINCFLMPHLGHEAVAEESFAGCLRDISRGFKSALIELVPSFFDPEHLTPKVINGERVKTRDLLEYFQSYVNIFNSDDTPVAVTILRATADACILAAVREARDLYESRMQARLRDEISVPASVLTALNDVARRDAIQRYNQKKKLGSQDSVAYHLEQLNTELDARLALYTSKNNDKFRDTESLARTAYRNVVSAVCEVHERLCLHPLDLTDLHAEALTAAVTLFDSTRHVLEDEEDEERVAFVRSLEEYYAHLCEVNEQKNRNAVLEARDLYVTRMQQQMIQVGVSSGLLQALHQRALDDARAFFANQRSRATERQDDPYLQQLLEEIRGSFANFERVNINNNTAALQGAKDSYNNYMSSAWGSRSYCFHPRALEDLHNTAKRQSLQQFLANRPESEHNEYEARLVEVVNSLYSELRTTNELINDQTVNEAYELYETKQEDHLNPSQTWTRFIPGYTKAELEMLPTLLPGYHAQSKEEAVQKFYSRRLGERHDGDVYYARLIERIDSLYERHQLRVSLIEMALG